LLLEEKEGEVVSVYVWLALKLREWKSGEIKRKEKFDFPMFGWGEKRD
jgi:hypothetical protein